MPRRRASGRANGITNGDGTATFDIKTWFAILVSVATALFSAGGYYFKVNELDKKIETTRLEMSENYVRKDVLLETLTGMKQQLMDQSAAISKMDVKLDGVTVAIAAARATTK